ncbi:hypothetical protein [Qipengyuania gaetbuli]|uniref:hypothetical protein n=1 Tax=Qipengyuania gaetbuli TaxID=266952 RepID=UPI001CFF2BB7|nr:hypothetical protein [Qipengyuania gaetbuli]
MKPASIKKFDMLYLGSIVVGLIGFAFNYGDLVETTNAELAAAGVEGMGGGIMIGSLIFGIVINLALWFLISGLRIEFVKWILVLFAAWAIFSLATTFGLLSGLNLVFTLVGNLMTLAAIYFLFQPDAKAWFAEKRGGN